MSIFTAWAVRPECSKVYDLAPDGELVKIPPRMFKHGKASRVETPTLQDFADMLHQMQPGNFLTAGVSLDENPVQDRARRLKQNFPFSKGEGLLILDGDDLDKYGIASAEEYVATLRSLDPAFQNVGFVTSSSASSFVKWPNGERGLRGLHCYAFIDEAIKVPQVIAALERLAMVKGDDYARGKVASNGRILFRSMVDAVMKSPHQVCFEGGSMKLNDLITQTREIKVFEGGVLCASAVDTGDVKQVGLVKKFKARWKDALMTESREKAQAWAAARVAAMVERGETEANAVLIVGQITKRIDTDRPLSIDLAPSWVIRFDDGRVVTVGDVSENPNAFDDARCSDPMEPDAGKSKAIFYANMSTGKPQFHSMLRGGNDRFFITSLKNNKTLHTVTNVTNFTDDLKTIDTTSLDENINDIGNVTAYLKTSPTSLIDGFTGKLLYQDDEGRAKKLPSSKARDRIIPHLKGRFAYDAAAQKYFTFTKTHWHTEENDVAGFMAAVHDLVEAGTDHIGFSSGYVKGIAELIQQGGSLPAPPIETANVLPFSNGLLDLKNRTLTPTTPRTALTWCLPYDYIQDADCPNIKAWLTHCFNGDADMVEYVRAWLAAILTGRADLQRFIYLKGPGGTGKSTLIKLTQVMVGEHNTFSTNLNELETGRFELAGVFGKRLLMITDAGRYRGSMDKLKSITGQDPLRLERKNKQQSGSFVYAGIVILASNEDLGSSDLTSGLERRRAVITMSRIVTEAEKTDWKQRGGEEVVLHAELPGLVNWLLQLSRDDVTRIITNPPEQTAISNHAAMLAGNPVARWLCECCIPSPNNVAVVGQCREVRADGKLTYENDQEHLYPNYLTFASGENIGVLSRNRFKETLIDTAQTLGIKLTADRKGNHGGSGLRGIRLKFETEPPHNWFPVKKTSLISKNVTDVTVSSLPQNQSQQCSKPISEESAALPYNFSKLPETFENVHVEGVL